MPQRTAFGGRAPGHQSPALADPRGDDGDRAGPNFESLAARNPLVARDPCHFRLMDKPNVAVGLPIIHSPCSPMRPWS